MSADEITGLGSSASDHNKPFRFEGSHFKRWQQKMLFFLTTKKLANVLKDDIPVVPEEGEKSEKDKIAVWDALKKKYDTVEAGVKKYVVSRYLKYQMTDDRSVEAQSHEIHKIAHEIISEVLKPNVKHLKNQNRTSKNSNKNGYPQRVPIARKPPPPRNGPLPFHCFNSLPFHCFNCGKEGHMARRCRNKLGAVNQANLTEEQFVAMITEINLVGGSDGWWIDTGVSRHVCYDRVMFKTYTAAEDKKMLLRDSHTTNVAGIGDVELTFTLGKTLILKDVIHTPEIRKNLDCSVRKFKIRFPGLLRHR
ncbi:uncharacterized protein [Cicer arietinum]|uniref:uncharacterized protein n=1 Tax=Cicer arietinum TaxID=3827 RepID=UPI00032A9185